MMHLCLFSGVAGFSLGFEKAGFEIVAFSEIDPFPCRVLAHRFPGVPNLGDVCGIDGETWRGKVDVITFGSPCQDLSVAGKRTGLKGERSGLFYEAIRVVAGARPAFAIFENVPGLFSSNGGRDFGAVLDAMADIGALDIAWRVLDAQYFGIPQRRRRVFVVADFRGFRAREVLFESKSLSGDYKKSREEGEVVAKSVGNGAKAGFTDTDRMTFIPVATPAAGPVSFGWQNSSEQGDEAIEDGCAPLRSNTTPAVAISENQGAELRTSEVHPQLSSGGGKPGQGYPAVALPLRSGRRIADSHGNAGNDIPSSMGVRRLTPLECERLQGFPDNFTNIPNSSDSARYRALGNAVAIPVTAWIASRLASVLQTEKEEVA